MADIDIQKKKAPIWPWILGLLVVAALIWLLVSVFNEDEDDVDDPVPVEQNDDVDEGADAAPAGDAGVDGAVVSYITWVENVTPQGTMGVEHDYTATGLRNLADALRGMVNRGYAEDANVKASMDNLDKTANQIQEDWKSTEHADMIKQAFMEATDVIDAIQNKSFPDMENNVEELRKHAQAIDKNTLTLDQKGDVKGYFEKSATALERMSEKADA